MKFQKGKSGNPKGKPRGTHNFAKRALAEIIESTISTEERMRLLAGLARGITVQESDKDGGVTVYQKEPSEAAIKQLNEMQYGRPRQAIEHSGPDGGAIPYEEIRESFTSRIAGLVERRRQSETTEEPEG